MRGRTVVVTGANRGIGRATALALAVEGARLVLVCRTAERAAAIADEVRARGGEAEGFAADFRSMAEVRAAARAIKARYDRIHVLVNNAGAIFPERGLTEDRVEQTFAVNHLGPFLLTVELLDVLRASAPSRIVNVASEAHRRGWMHWHDLHFRSDYRPLRAYAQAKLATVLFTRELARRLAGTGLTANALHPGTVDSGVVEIEAGWPLLLHRLKKPFLASPETGARTSVYLASAPEVEGISGRYFIKCRPFRPTGYGRDDGLARRIWTTSEGILGTRTADAA